MKTTDSLKKLFADNFAAYVLAHGLHQNVVGDEFYQFHRLFEKIYVSLQDSIDDIGELIRTLDEIAPFSLTRIKQLTDIEDVQSAPDAIGMVEILDGALYALIDQANTVFEDSQADKEYGVNNYIGGYIQELNKFCYFLKATDAMKESDK